MSSPGLRTRSKGTDLLVVLVFLSLSAMAARSFFASPPTRALSPRIAAFRDDLVSGLQHYCGSKEVEVQLTPHGDALDCLARVDFRGNRRPRHWVHKVIRFLAEGHHVPVGRLNVWEGKAEVSEHPPQGSDEQRFESKQAERLGLLGQGELERVAVLVDVKATRFAPARSAGVPPRRSRCRLLKTTPDFIVGHLEILVLYENQRDVKSSPESVHKLEDIVKQSIGFAAERGDSFELLALP